MISIRHSNEHNMKYKHIVFDIDGTLIDTEKAVLKSLQVTIKEYQNREVAIDELRFALGIPGNVALQKLGITNIKEVNAAWNIYMSEYAHTIEVFDGIERVLSDLRTNGLELGIISSKTHKEYKSDFSPFALEKYFGTVICFEDSMTPKPTAAPMLAYLKRTGANPDEVIYIGDTIYDMQCAKSAGVDFGLALWGCHSDDIRADCYFKSPTEILDLPVDGIEFN